MKLIILALYRYGLPGTMGVSIRATDQDGAPAGQDLIYVEADANNLPTIYTTAKLELPLGDGLELEKDTLYAIIARAQAGNFDNYIRWRFQRPAPYPRGVHVFSSDAGVHWEHDTTRDLRFEEWGD